MDFRSLVTPVLALAVGLSACQWSFHDPDEAPGELGLGNFKYECLNNSDTSCASGERNFPQAVAVGARFGMTFREQEGSSARVVSASPASVRQDQAGFVMQRPGFAALVAMDGTGALDLRHVRGAPIVNLRFNDSRGLALSKVQLEPREEETVLAIPQDEDNVALGGAVDYEWDSTRPEVVVAYPMEDSSHALLVAVASGQAHVVVTLPDDQRYELEVIVELDAADRANVRATESDGDVSDAGLLDDTQLENVDTDAGLELMLRRSSWDSETQSDGGAQ